MSRRGENIYKRKDGRWEGRYIKGRDVSGKARYGYIYGRSYRQVREKLAAAKAAIPSAASAGRHTLNHYCCEWLLLSSTRVKESTYVKYCSIIRRHIQPRLGSCQMQNLTAAVIGQFTRDLLDAGLSPKTVRDILTLLRSVLRYCQRTSGLLLPVDEIVYPREHRQEMRVLSAAEQNLFISYLLSGADLDCTRFGILLALLTGMRIGEICALRWEDISLDERIIHITATLQRLPRIEDTLSAAGQAPYRTDTTQEDGAVSSSPRTRIVIGDAKSRSSARLIPLSASALELCQRMRPENGRGYVLTGGTERFMEPRMLQYYLKKYTAACGLEGVHFHTLRHTFATRCVEVGFDIKSLSEILGHASTRITLDRYVHSSLELKRVNMEKLSAAGL